MCAMRAPTIASRVFVSHPSNYASNHHQSRVQNVRAKKPPRELCRATGEGESGMAMIRQSTMRRGPAQQIPAQSSQRLGTVGPALAAFLDLRSTK